MGIILWIILGAVAGWIASIIMRSNQGIVGDVILGVIGAVVGGFLMNLLGAPGVTGLNIYSILVAIAGAVVLIFLGRLFTGGARI